MLRPGLVWTTYRTIWIKWKIQQCPPPPSNNFFKMIVFIIFCENLPFLKLSAGTVSILPPNKHMHTQTQRAGSFKQIIVFSHWKKSIHIPWRDDTAESLCFQSWIFIQPTTNNGHLSVRSFWTSLFSVSPILPLFLRFGPISSRAILGLKSFTGSCSTASDIVNSRMGLGLCVIAAIRFWIWTSFCMEIDLCLRWAGGQRQQPAVCVI